MSKFAIFWSPYCGEHFIDDDHPEEPDRVLLLLETLRKQFIDFQFISSKPALDEQILLFHSEEVLNKFHSYADEVEKLAEEFPNEIHHKHIDMDTIVMPKTRKAVLHAVGAAIDAIDRMMLPKTDELYLESAFCCVRPPGHHAEPDKSFGFCFFNTIGISSKYLLSKYGFKRVAVLDFDVHHGNGLLNQSHGHSGTFLALAGKDGLVLATDSRTTKSQSQAFLIGYHPRTIYKLGSRTLLGCYGLESDANSLVKSIEEKFQDHIEEEVEPESIARVISDILYQSNLYVSPMIVGLTKECKPFICSMDGLGAQTRSDTYAAIGTSSSGLLALCESVYQPNLPVEELSTLTEKCLKQAFQRDILSGGDIRIVSLKKNQQIENKIVKFLDV